VGSPQPKPDSQLDSTNESPTVGVRARIKSFIEDTKSRASPDSPGDWKMLNIADQTFDAMQGAIARQKLAAYPPDRTIMIARDACGTLEFDRAVAVEFVDRLSEQSKQRLRYILAYADYDLSAVV